MRRLLPALALGCALVLPASAAAAPTFTNFHFNSPTGTPRAVTSGPDGNVWFTDDQDPNHVGRITTSGSATEWAVTHDGGADEIAAGANYLWFSETNKNLVGRISTGGVLREFPVSRHPAGIAVGPDGNLWLAQTEGDGSIARMTTGGAVTTITAGLSKNADPTDIVSGPDGRLWFTETGVGKIGAITTQGTITEYSVHGTPQQITVGPDGNLWFTQTGVAPAIGRITPAGTVLADFPVTLGAPQGIVTGADGNVYYTNPVTNAVGQVTPAGTITEYSAGITAAAGLTDITSGPDGRIWFGEHAAGSIGRMTVAPAARATTATGVDAGSATLTAPVNPNSTATTYTFEWGPTTSYGSTSSATSAGASAVDQTASATLTGLSPSTTYHAHVVATNSAGTTSGPDMTFTTTPPGAPSATTLAPSASDASSATIEGVVNPELASTGYHFEWGPTASYGTSLPASNAAVGNDGADHAVNQALSGLQPNTVYHYRVVATNTTGTTNGGDQAFTTDGVLPDATTDKVTGVTSSHAVIFGKVNPRNTATTYRFEWGTSTTYDHVAPALDATVGSNNSTHTVNEVLSGLDPSTTYHFRVVATSAEGVSYGADMTFTTDAAPPAAGPDKAATDVPADTTPLGIADPPLTSLPTLGKAVAAAKTTGTVLVRKPGQTDYTALAEGDSVPVGAVVDATNGTFTLTSALDRNGHTQNGKFWGGRFTVRQTASEKGVVEIGLVGRPTGCGKGVAHAAAKRKPIRLWGQDNHGKFRTRGRYSAATVRGTKWLTTETCAGTRTTVAAGAVSVVDKVRHRTVVVRAGHSYLARAPKR
jgi:streptogramin lyase